MVAAQSRGAGLARGVPGCDRSPCFATVLICNRTSFAVQGLADLNVLGHRPREETRRCATWAVTDGLTTWAALQVRGLLPGGLRGCPGLQRDPAKWRRSLCEARYASPAEGGCGADTSHERPPLPCQRRPVPVGDFQGDARLPSEGAAPQCLPL